MRAPRQCERHAPRLVVGPLEELGLDHEVVPVNLQQNQQMTPEFLALNPNHKIPVLEDDGLVIWESGAILLYLGEKYGNGRLVPKDEKKRRLGVIDRILTDGRPHLACEYSIGDIMHFPWRTFLVAMKVPA